MSDTSAPKRNDDCRCLSSAEVLHGVNKRCIRAMGHVERHAWLESEQTDSHLFLIATWDDFKRVSRYPVEVQPPAAGAPR